MRPTSNRLTRRPGFTLVELLVVMTIIAILFALTSAAVVKALVKMDETKTRNEISQLQSAVQAFKTDFGVTYIPDTMVLPPGANTVYSQYLTSVWPRLATAALTTGSYWGLGSNTPVTLKGYQSLVFFLGGAPDPSGSGGRIGFSTDPTNPMSLTGSLGAGTRKGPYFDFPPGRLLVLSGDTTFPGFIDTYGTMPYLYFSATKAGNDYSTTSQLGVLPFQIGSSSTNGLVRYANANGFQIICAGRDTVFGPGGINWPGYSNSGVPGATTLTGYDDMANFHPTLLGIPAQ